MKKIIFFLLLSIITLNAKAGLKITPCPNCWSTFTVQSTGDTLICHKDSTFYCRGYGTGQPTVEACQQEFDSLYILLPISQITKWGDAYIKDEKQLAYKEESSK